MPSLQTDQLHGAQTTRSSFQYLFTVKHHSISGKDATWLAALTFDEEFGVFNLADVHAIAGSNGNLYGVLPGTNGALRELGTRHEEVAEFPLASQGAPWHGYPKWALNDDDKSKRGSQKMRPEKAVFQLMKQVGLIDEQQCKRFMKGDVP